mgnify:CR=1 FL=1|jgi:hypothetical protein
MRNKLIALTMVGLVSQVMAGGVFFSEYIEGSSNNKALEIYNNTGADINMADYAIWRISNGGDWVEGEGNAVQFDSADPELITDLVVADGEVFVMVNSSADPVMQAVADFSGTSAMWFNGDDAMGLAHFDGVAWNLIDIIGEEGPDVGSEWNPPGTQENTIVRNETIVEGELDWAVSSLTWTTYPQDTFDYLGSHTLNAGANVVPVVSAVVVLPEMPTALDAVAISADVVDTDGTVLSANLFWGMDAGAMTNVIPMSNVGGDTWAADSDIPAFPGCTKVYYQIVALDNAGDPGESSVDSYTVECFLTIAEIQGQHDVDGSSNWEGYLVNTSGVITTLGYNLFIIQDGYGPYSAIYVYGSYSGLNLYDEVEITATVLEYNGLTELADATTEPVDLGAPVVHELVTPAVAITEGYECVAITIESGISLDLDHTYYGWNFDFDGTTILVDDKLDYHYGSGFAPTVGQCYSFTGFMGVYNDPQVWPLPDGYVSCDVAEAVETTNSFALLGNYPNPFNPTTMISFSLDQTSMVNLVVTDMLGRTVAVVADETMVAGSHSLNFDASNLSSGVYFYTLSAGGNSLTSKMLLMR